MNLWWMSYNMIFILSFPNDQQTIAKKKNKHYD